MDITSFTEADLARLAMSARLRDLSEAFRVAVAAEDGGAETTGEPGLAARLWSLLTTEIPVVQEAIVQHVRGGGGSWADVAAVTALSEDEARDRWSGAAPSRVANPVAEAAALDEWYVRYAGLEPLAQFRDPVSRLLSTHPGRAPECHICVKYKGGALPPHAGRATPPGGHLLDDGRWRVGHGPTPFWPAGTLLIESHRHFLDFAEMDDDEAAAIGPLIRRLMGPLREATGAPRIHVFSCMEGAPHFHVWLVPRIGDVASGRTFIGDPGYCSVPEAEAMITRIREAMTRAEADR
ncbi:MAG: hypothetical protein GEV28_22905 [Actinophytocola sp.]|uniref:HIT family protein n=1 Tax=Actinophytocola sp. TaxID=1872138 RepID=UPI0013228121|nr:hypothetical protein [Actinophytocola sp.]MPZ83083.1 hypothetical protein [Actinophytocola sp.]